MSGRLLNVSRNIIVGVLGKILSSIFPFLTRTLIIRLIGIEYLGVNGLFSSILSILSLSELGFGSAIVFSMYSPLANKDEEKVNALLNLYRTIYRCVGLFIIIAGFCLIPFIDKLITGSIPEDLSLVAVYVLFLINTALSYLMSAYRASLLSANQREDLNSIVDLGSNLIMYILQLVVLLFTRDYMLYLIAMPVGVFIANTARYFVSRHFFPQYQCRGKVDKDELLIIKKNVISLVGSKLSSIVMRSSDTIVLSTMFGLNVVGIYSNYSYVLTVLDGFFYIFFNGLTASVGNKLVCESLESNKKVFMQISQVSTILAGTCCICLVCLTQDFIRIWAGPGLLLPDSAVVSLALYIYFQKVLDGLTVYRGAQGLYWEDRYRPLIQSVFYIVLNIIFIKVKGANGLYLASVLTVLLINLPMLHRLVFNHGFADISKKWAIQFIGNTSFLVVIGFCIKQVASKFKIVSFSTFFLYGLIIGAMSLSLFTIFSLFNKDFRQLCLNLCIRIKRRVNGGNES